MATILYEAIDNMKQVEKRASVVTKAVARATTYVAVVEEWYAAEAVGMLPWTAEWTKATGPRRSNFARLLGHAIEHPRSRAAKEGLAKLAAKWREMDAAMASVYEAMFDLQAARASVVAAASQIGRRVVWSGCAGGRSSEMAEEWLDLVFRETVQKWLKKMELTYISQICMPPPEYQAVVMEAAGQARGQGGWSRQKKTKDEKQRASIKNYIIQNPDNTFYIVVNRPISYYEHPYNTDDIVTVTLNMSQQFITSPNGMVTAETEKLNNEQYGACGSGAVWDLLLRPASLADANQK
jgi:hypothetical protein